MTRLLRAAVLGSGLVLVAGVTLIALGAMSPSKDRQETDAMASVEETHTPSTAPDIPAIDLSVPENTETATFALG